MMVVGPLLHESDRASYHCNGTGGGNPPHYGATPGRRRNHVSCCANREQAVFSQPISTFGNSDDEPRVTGVVTQRDPNLTDAVVDAVLEVDVGVATPDRTPNFIMSDESASVAHQQRKEGGRLWFEPGDRPGATHLAADLIELTVADELNSRHPINVDV